MIYQPLRSLEIVYRGWGEEWIVGRLVEGTVRGHWLFEYTAEALERGIELSPLQVPLSTETYADFERHQDRLPGFVADSLPDGWGRLLTDRLLRRNQLEPARVSVLDRLALLGENTMGALTYRPLMSLPDNQQDEYNIHNLLDLAQQVREEVTGQDSEALRELVRLGGSPHGARPKAVVNYNPGSGEMGTTPFSGSEAWLVKFPSALEESWVCAMEEVYARMARQAGIAFPESQYFPLSDGLAAFGVHRFDRQGELRIPVMSMAGALHADFRLPSLDYSQVLKATSLITRSAAEKEIQARRMVFNVLMNNRDDHAKNFSFILNAEDEWEVSPAYDLTFQDGPGGEHQTAVMGYGRNITRSMMVKAGESAGIPANTMKSIIDEVADIAVAFVRVADAFADIIPRKEILFFEGRINQNLNALQK
ncbi:type II toxin-antitoxin system HipA family toxin [Dryocola clanedunensis]